MKLTEKEILEVVPIRKPMLCIDEICDVEFGQSVVGARYISKEEYWADCHFVTKSIFPGTLIIETMAQISAFMFYKRHNPIELKSYLGKVDKMRFIKKIVPECKMIVKADLIEKIDRIAKIRCKAYVDNDLMASGEVTLYFENDEVLASK